MSLSKKRLTKRLIGGKTIMRTVYIEEHVKEFIKKLFNSRRKEKGCKYGQEVIEVETLLEEAGKELVELQKDIIKQSQQETFSKEKHTIVVNSTADINTLEKLK